MSKPFLTRAFLGAATALTLTACGDPSSPAMRVGSPSTSAVKQWETGSSVAWNRTARELMAARGAPFAGPIVQVRILTYLSIAQYNAVVAAEDANSPGG